MSLNFKQALFDVMIHFKAEYIIFVGSNFFSCILDSGYGAKFSLLQLSHLVYIIILFGPCSVYLAKIIFANLFYYSVDFCYYSWASLHFLVLFMGSTVLFRLTFIFIYNTFSKKFLVSAK